MKSHARYALAVSALLLLASCGSESEPAAKAEPSTTATPRADVEARDPVLVMNDDGSASLSTQIVNHVGSTQSLQEALISDDDREVRIYTAGSNPFAPHRTVAVGRESDPVMIRFYGVVKPGEDTPATLPLYLQFSAIHGIEEKYTDITVDVPVVERTAKYDDVAGNKPNTAITVENARITVLPGQHKAYVDGTVVATITDNAYTLPTAFDADGNPVRYRHQTATGGPYGLFAQKGKEMELGGGPPYKEGEGDADYFDAKDVTVGETITVTIPFQSGDVIVPFTVVAG